MRLQVKLETLPSSCEINYQNVPSVCISVSSSMCCNKDDANKDEMAECIAVPELVMASATTLKMNNYLLRWYFLASVVAIATAAATGQ